jgi:hypothetical protein
MRNVSDKIVEKIKVLCSIFFFFENHAVCEITWKRGQPADHRRQNNTAQVRCDWHAGNKAIIETSLAIFDTYYCQQLYGLIFSWTTV